MALMKCQGLSPTSWGSGSGARPCTRAISIMWSVKFAPAQKIPPGVGTGANSLVLRSGRPSVFLPAAVLLEVLLLEVLLLEVLSLEVLAASCNSTRAASQ